MGEKQGISQNIDLSAEIVAADAARVQALVNVDEPTLQRLFSDELVFVHSSGRSETKGELINHVVQGVFDYRSIVTTRRDLRTVDELVFDNGDADIDLVIGGELRQVAVRYLMVWKRDNGAWQLFRFHAAPIARTAADK